MRERECEREREREREREIVFDWISRSFFKLDHSIWLLFMTRKYLVNDYRNCFYDFYKY